MAAGFGLPGFLERWKNDWIDPALGLIDNQRPTSDAHLNDVSIEYREEDVKVATRNFDAACTLGSGTFGSVYRGTMGDGTEVAIKVLQVPEEAGFEDEVKVLSRFRHPNLVILMGFARHAETGGRSLIYEYLSGGDVSKRLQKSRQRAEPFEWRQRLSAGLDAACGLSHLHNMNPRAFHRDIKGPNILLDRNGTAKMADFGLACVASGSQHKVRQASGTVGYACPEYIRTGIITEGSEVHSFGMVLLELLTGAPPAVQRPDKPTEFCYIVDHLQGRPEKVKQMLDPSGHFPASVSQEITEMAFRCITQVSADRPLFKQLVEELRGLYQRSANAEATPPAKAAPDPLSVTTPAGEGSLLAQGRKHIVAMQADPLSITAPAGGEGRKIGVQQSPQQAQRVGGVAANGGYPQQRSPPPQQQQRRVVLSVGTPVECRWRGRSGWFCGRIARVNADGTFAVRYSDGDFEDGVAAHLIRATEVPAPPVPGNPPPRPSSDGPAGDVGLPPQPPPAQSTSSSRGAGVSPGVAAGVAPPPRAVPAVGRRSREDTAPPSCRLWCVYSEGVELSKLGEPQRSVPWPAAAQDMPVGRTAQPAAFWDTLVPDRRLHGTISREHFRIKPADGQGADMHAPAWCLSCTSLNGVLLNSKYVAQGESKPLQHGDVIAFTASEEPTGGMRKPFIVFSFEVIRAECRSPQAGSASVPSAAPSPSPATPPPPEEAESAPKVPPANTVAGRWRNPGSGAGVLDDAIFCLEVHGEGVRTDLPVEARQLFFCCEAAAPTLPALRVGRGYQHLFWQRVLEPGLLGGRQWASAMAVDQFEVRAFRRSNPGIAETPDWRFRLYVMGVGGVSVNYSVTCSAGEDRELHPSDTLTVGGASSSGGGDGRRKSGVYDIGPPPGLHFTFIPFVGALDRGDRGAQGRPAAERPRQLPECDALWGDDGLGDAAVGRRPVAAAVASAPAGTDLLSSREARALKPPTAFVEDPEVDPSEERDQVGELASMDRHGDASGQGQLQTRILAPSPGGPVDQDDLFSRTGFQGASAGANDKRRSPI